MSIHRNIVSPLKGMGFRHWAVLALIALGIVWLLTAYRNPSSGPEVPGSIFPEEVKWEQLKPTDLVSFPSRTKAADLAGKPYPMVQGYLRKPPGPGPFPAVVVNHSRYIFPHYKAWVDRLAEWGYVAMLVHLRPLRVKGLGLEGDPTVVERTDAAFSALGYLQRQSFVRADKVGALGWYMWGGNAVMMALEASPEKPDQPYLPLFTLRPEQRFRAGVAYYPNCPNVLPFYSAPLLVFVGDKDPRYQYPACKKLETQTMNPSQPMQTIVYPGATHAFDAGMDGVDDIGNPYFYDAAATADSTQRIRAFLDQHLK
ncbi:MAG: dienelactone hydrolase family protein [Deltaproteobacteria bacterium]|nr:dienelactone hydrolase family protein [Deltaproteobacteria bacterium]